MSELVSELQGIYRELESFAESLNKPDILEPLDALEQSAKKVEKAWGHSWLGYQSRVYGPGLKPPLPGANFSIEWGFERVSSGGTRGEWQEFPEDAVETEIRMRAGYPDTTKAREAADKGRKFFEDKRDDVVSILGIAKGPRDDPFLDKLIEETKEVKAFTASEIIDYMRPPGPVISR